MPPEEKAEVPDDHGNSEFTLGEQKYKLFLGKAVPADPRKNEALSTTKSRN